MIEKEVERHLHRLCEVEGWECLKLELNNVRGFPDRTILTPFGVYFVELKRPKGGVISPHQMYWRGRIQKHQHWVLLHTIEAVEKFISTLRIDKAARERGIR